MLVLPGHSREKQSKGRGSRSSVSLQRRGDRGSLGAHRLHVSLFLLIYSFQTSPVPTSPPALLPGSGSILTSPWTARGQGSSASLSKKMEMKERTALLIPPSTPLPIRQDACIVAWPNGLIFYFFCFAPPPPRRLPHCIRCSMVPSAGLLPNL